MSSAPSSLGRASLLFSALAFATPGCTSGDDNNTGGGETGDGGVCPDCEPGEDAYLCIIDGEEFFLCFEDLTAAVQTCGAKPGNGVVGNAPAPCDNHRPPPGVDWDPGSFVHYDEETQTREIERWFLEMVLSDPNLLLNDRARLAWGEDHFEFRNISNGDLVDLLGFADGDILTEVNGHPLTNMLELGEAYEELREESSFSVVVVRDHATTVLDYLVVDDE